MIVDKNMNFSLIHISESKLPNISMTDQQEQDIENDPNRLNSNVYKPKRMSYGSIETEDTPN